MVKRMSLAEAQRKLELLKLADDLGNVVEACKQLGYSRDSFYRYRRIYETEGIDGLHGTSRRKPNLKNRLSPEIENTIIELGIKKPSLSRDDIQGILQERGTTISSSGVGNVLKRHRLGSKRERFDALEAEHARKFAKKPEVLVAEELAALNRRVAQLESKVERPQSSRRPRRPKAPVKLAPRAPTPGGLLHKLLGDAILSACPTQEISKPVENNEQKQNSQSVRTKAIFSALLHGGPHDAIRQQLAEMDNFNARSSPSVSSEPK